MKQSHSFIRTIQEVHSNVNRDPNELLIRAGYIRMQEGGFISYLPLAKRVISKIETIIREEMNQLLANEISLPVLNPLPKRLSDMELVADEIFHIKDQQNDELYLSPSHEEILTSLVKEEINSYKQLPLVLYQIQTKFRDELKHSGIFKSREFIMKDAYSFHQSIDDLNNFYEKMEQSYSNIFRQLGLQYKKVVGDLGNYRGESSHELIVLSEHGDVTIVFSNESDYAVNLDLAQVIEQPNQENCETKQLTKQDIEGFAHFEEFIQHSNLPLEKIIKSKTYKVNDELIVVLYRGDHTLNEMKLKTILNVQKLKLADNEVIRERIGCSSHSVGPIKLPVKVNVIADHGIKTICNGVAGGNEDGFYYQNVNPERDFAINSYADIRYIQEGEPSPDGLGTIQFTKGYEVGHTFKLGSTYTTECNATFVDEFGKTNPLLMGAYGLGVSRIFAVASEIYQDDKGLAWPTTLAPYNIHLLTEDVENEEEWTLSEQLYNILTTYQFDVLLDDREISINEKIKDADLIGLPVQVIVGNKANEGIVKVNYRRTGESFECAKEVLIDHLNEFFRTY